MQIKINYPIEKIFNKPKGFRPETRDTLLWHLLLNYTRKDEFEKLSCKNVCRYYVKKYEITVYGEFWDIDYK